MARKSRKEKAIEAINRQGVLLVFPVKNQKEPSSLWNELFPQKAMLWEWSDDGDNSVFVLWALMKELSAEGEVVYSKWYQNRATFFSRNCFKHLLAWGRHNLNSSLSYSAQQILDELESNSPLSTKEIKEITGLKGKLLEPEYSRAIKDLFQRFLIVGFGEVDDGAFPSAALGATRLIFEDLWLESQKISQKSADTYVQEVLGQHKKCHDFLMRNKKKMQI